METAIPTSTPQILPAPKRLFREVFADVVTVHACHMSGIPVTAEALIAGLGDESVSQRVFLCIPAEENREVQSRRLS